MRRPMIAGDSPLRARIILPREDAAPRTQPSIACGVRGCSAQVGSIFSFNGRWSGTAYGTNVDDVIAKLGRVLSEGPVSWWVSLAPGFVQDATGLWELSQRAAGQWRLAKRQRIPWRRFQARGRRATEEGATPWQARAHNFPAVALRFRCPVCERINTVEPADFPEIERYGTIASRRIASAE